MTLDPLLHRCGPSPAPPAPRKRHRTAILSALAQEQHGLIGLLAGGSREQHAGREFWLGDLHGQPVVLALSRIGKVAAATTATALIERFDVARMIFTGVAGSLSDAVNIGDVLVADQFIQHDLDASPIFPRFEVPLYGRACFATDAALTAALFAASVAALARRQAFLPDPSVYPSARVHCGLIATGDAFVSGVAESAALRQRLGAAGHLALAVEMEGAAVAQVCDDYGLPFAAMRTVSDRADDSAHIDFPAFVEQVASRYAEAILQIFLRSLSKK